MLEQRTGQLLSVIEFAESCRAPTTAEKNKNKINKEVRCDLWSWLQLQPVCADTADLLVQDTVVEERALCVQSIAYLTPLNPKGPKLK